MAWCLTLQKANEFKKALKDGKIDPAKLAAMTSLERRVFLENYVGGENAKQVNALFESKLLLKNQQRGMITWAKRVSGITPKVRRDLLARIERMENILEPAEQEQFLQELASARLRIDVTREEAETISKLTKNVADLKSKANNEGVFSTEKDKFEYGASKVAIEKYINNLKLQSKRIFFKEQPLKKVLGAVGEIPGVMKSALASLDNSFWGRQGIKTLLDVRTSKVWFKNFLKSWGDMSKELKGVDAMDIIKADIYSRPNALNGKYDAGNYGLSVLSEEAYPSSWPEKIPLFGRLFKASESAYNGGALRLRADLADRLIKIAEKQGVNTLNREEARGMGHLISSLTGRGSLGKGEVAAKELNVLLFSAKFLKGNFDTLTAHRFDPRATSFAKKEAAKNLLSIVATIASILTIANQLNPDSVEEDPRSTNFGKIKIFGHWVDITGGMASLVTLSSRLVPTRHNGQWGLWSKSSAGNWTDLTAGKYGQQTALDVFENFWEGKLSPVAGLVRDVWKGKNFEGEPVTFKNVMPNLFTPISIQNFDQLRDDPNSSFIFGSMILDGLGLSTSTYRYRANWETSTSKEMKQFKKEVGKEKFKQANGDFNQAYSQWFGVVSQTTEYKRLSDEGKSSLATKAKSGLKDKIFREYGFRYRKPRKTSEEREEEKVIKKLAK